MEELKEERVQTSANIPKKRIAIIGGGPAGLFLLRRFVKSEQSNLSISIFEKKTQLGAGMPYSTEGANPEHITNVSANEIPELETGVTDWLAEQPKSVLDEFGINARHFSEYRVLPRLLFGKYLEDQFDLVLQKAKKIGIEVTVHTQTLVTDVADLAHEGAIQLLTDDGSLFRFQHVVICSGHKWHKGNEATKKGYFDSPYPPSKLQNIVNQKVALRGASLTAIDAIRTLARNNGKFREESGKLHYDCHPNCEEFKIYMHTRNGLLPAVRFHLEDSHLQSDSLLTEKEIADHMNANDGFLSLDYLFEKDFKELFRERDPIFYDTICNLSLEEFVGAMMRLRENPDPFVLLKEEYIEAEKSIRKKESVYWKEALAILSFAMNYPAKHFSAEDMLRLQQHLKPLISIVIAFIPQSSCREMMALHEAGRLEMVTVGNESRIVPLQAGGIRYEFTDADEQHFSEAYSTFIDCVGQEAMDIADFPFRTLLTEKTIQPAYLRFRDPEAAKAEMERGNNKIMTQDSVNYYLQVPGVGIGDDFHVTDAYGANSERVAIMSVPYIAGFNPDYSGLDFCEAASEKIVLSILRVGS